VFIINIKENLFLQFNTFMGDAVAELIDGVNSKIILHRLIENLAPIFHKYFYDHLHVIFYTWNVNYSLNMKIGFLKKLKYIFFSLKLIFLPSWIPTKTKNTRIKRHILTLDQFEQKVHCNIISGPTVRGERNICSVSTYAHGYIPWLQ